MKENAFEYLFMDPSPSSALLLYLTSTHTPCQLGHSPFLVESTAW